MTQQPRAQQTGGAAHPPVSLAELIQHVIIFLHTLAVNERAKNPGDVVDLCPTCNGSGLASAPSMEFANTSDGEFSSVGSFTDLETTQSAPIDAADSLATTFNATNIDNPPAADRVVMVNTTADDLSALNLNPAEVPPEPVEDKAAPEDTPTAPVKDSSNPVSNRWYAVTRGTRCGVFSSWEETAPYVVGVSGACFARHPSYQAALRAFNQGRRVDREVDEAATNL